MKEEIRVRRPAPSQRPVEKGDLLSPILGDHIFSRWKEKTAERPAKQAPNGGGRCGVVLRKDEDRTKQVQT